MPKNHVVPPPAPLTVPPLFVNVPSAAVELWTNCVAPPCRYAAVPPLLMKLALPALELSKNAVEALKKLAPTGTGLLVKMLELSAVALLLKNITVSSLPPVTKFCSSPELLRFLHRCRRGDLRLFPNCQTR